MDEAIRALVRAATTQGGDGGDEAAQAELDRACDRAGLELPREVVSWLPRWRRLRWLVDGWLRRPLLGGPGGDPAQLERAVERLGPPLPRELREAWRLVGDRPEAGLEPPGAWRLEPYPPYGPDTPSLLVLGVDLDPPYAGTPFGIREDDLGLTNPRVSSPRPPDPTDDASVARYVEVSPTITSLVVSRLLRTMWHDLPRLRGPDDLFHDEVRRAFVHGPGFAALRTALEPLGVPCPRGADFPLGLHADDDTLLLADHERGLVCARTPAAWAKVLERVNRFAPS